MQEFLHPRSIVRIAIVAIPARTPPVSFADTLLGEEGNNNLHPRFLVRIATVAIPATACPDEEFAEFFKDCKQSLSRPTYLYVVCNAHLNGKTKFITEPISNKLIFSFENFLLDFEF